MGATGRCSVKNKSDDAALVVRFDSVITQMGGDFYGAVILLWPNVPEASLAKLDFFGWRALYLDGRSSPEIKAFALGKMRAIGISFEEARQCWRNNSVHPELRQLALQQMSKLGDHSGWLQELERHKNNRSDPELGAFYLQEALKTASDCKSCLALSEYTRGDEEAEAVLMRAIVLASTLADWCPIHKASTNEAQKRWALMKFFVTETFDNWAYFYSNGACGRTDCLFALLQMQRLAVTLTQWSSLHRLSKHFPEISQHAFEMMRRLVLAGADKVETEAPAAES